ncbi:MAG: hypothetical protein M0T75_06540 [Chloroflexi bacterium]|nr:hypothetical protein [Chloroflexota bacterium]
MSERHLAGPEDARRVGRRARRAARFIGASNGERLPTEVAITESMRRFTRISRAAS